MELTYALVYAGAPMNLAGLMVSFFDTDRDGKLSKEEFSDVDSTQLFTVMSEKMFKITDADGDGVITTEEFTAALNRAGYVEPKAVEKLIKQADTDNDGKVNFKGM